VHELLRDYQVGVALRAGKEATKVLYKKTVFLITPKSKRWAIGE
jgi:hypothetical protein